MNDRHIRLDHVFNLRDLGGYATADGRRVRWRRLFRGAGLQRLAGPDAATVAGLSLHTVLDLRTAGEVALGGFPPEVGDVVHHHLPLLARLWDHEDLNGEQPPERLLLARYEAILDEGSAAIAGAVRVLADDDAYPAAFFCAAGKDRTGIVAAIVLAAVGVPEDDIAEDYALSREPVERILRRAREESDDGGTGMIHQSAALLACPPEAMRLMLAGLRERHGSVAGYLESIDVDAGTVSGLRDALLES